MISKEYDVVIIGSGAGGGTVAAELAQMVKAGFKVLLLEQGPRIEAREMTGNELDMASALYADRGGFLTADGTMTLAFARAYGGSTVVYTGTSLVAPDRVIRSWGISGLTAADVARRCTKYIVQNNVHILPPEELNENNRLFVTGCAGAGFHAEQFPVNVFGCKGSSLCNLGCPNGAKMGTNAVQLPMAERGGVEVVTRAEAKRIEERAVIVHVREKEPGEKGKPGEWAPGEYRVKAKVIVCSGGAIGTPALLLRSGYGRRMPALGTKFTCHPALILVAEHDRAITNDVGHPKSFYLDRAVEEGFVLETCMYFPFTTAKNISGFGEEHSATMRAFPRLQMILALACDRALPGNRVTVDRNGEPVVHYEFTPRVIQSMTRATRAAAKIFFAAGAQRVHAPLANPSVIEARDKREIDRLTDAKHFKAGKVSVAAAHLMGGAAMGPGRSTSVTDGWGRVHGLPWLRIADASLFPDSLEINPYLTIMALADRVAEAVRVDAPSLFGRSVGPS